MEDFMKYSLHTQGFTLQSPSNTKPILTEDDELLSCMPDESEFKAPSSTLAWRDIPLGFYAIKNKKIIDTSIGKALVLTLINKDKQTYEAFAPQYLSQCLQSKHRYIKVNGKKMNPSSNREYHSFQLA